MDERSRRGGVPSVVAWVLRRLRSIFGLGPQVRQSLVALGLNASTSLVAGAVLGSLTDTLERFPGLLIMVPAAIGLRGNIFSAFGNRISTAIHVGEFEETLRRGGQLRQNVDASMVLTLFMSAVLAVLAWVVGAAVGVDGLSSPLTLATISILGGVLASLLVLAASLVLVRGAVRYGWDLDNVVAPVVSTLGDVLTLPALWLASIVAGVPVVNQSIGAILVVASLTALVWGLREDQALRRRVVKESLAVLTVAALLSTLAGLVLEQRLVTLAAFPALLVLQPAFVSSAGALGGILSSRTASKLHLGLVHAAWVPEPDVRSDALLIAGLFLPVYVFNGAGAHVVAAVLGQPSPGLGAMVAVSLLGGVAAVAFGLAVGYYGTVTALRAGVDPDTYGIPVVTSTVDFGGAVALITAAAVLGVTAT